MSCEFLLGDGDVGNGNEARVEERGDEAGGGGDEVGGWVSEGGTRGGHGERFEV